jgi:hypothetical protein
VSDAAPLPRLGEVFFDVRGNSRSMRLSWYADTGVAVFSIWQAGMCTGTFRLPIGDLSRMIEILERGPSPQGRGRAPVSGGRRGPERGGADYGNYPAEDDEIGLLDSAGPSGQGGYSGGDYTAEYGGTGQYARGPYDGRPAAAGDGGRGDRGASAGHSPDGGTVDYPAADYGSAGYGDPGYEQTSYGDPGYEHASYGDAGHRGPAHSAERPRNADYGAAGYEPADYGAGDPDGHGAAAYDYQRAGDGRRGYAEDDPVRRGGSVSDDYVRGGYSSAGPDYLTGEHSVSGYHDAMRGDGGPEYRSGGYGSQPAFPAGGRQRDDGRFSPDPGGPQSVETDGLGYNEERFVPPYVQGSGDSYLNDDRPRASGYGNEADDAGYPAEVPPVSAPDGYHEAQWPGEAYSYGTEYRRR